jgi:alkylated DNA repair dioxygenase AlkB
METNIVIQTQRSSLKLIKHNYKELIEKIIEEIQGKLEVKPEIIVFGKVCNQNRNIAFYSNDSIGYHYSNRLLRSKPLTDNLQILLNHINEKFNSDFNGILINQYMNGCDYIGAHSDDETNLGKIGVVALSYGAQRNFRVRNKNTRKIVENVDTKDDEILVMDGDFQKEFTHEIPVQKKIKGIRYSFTFRKHTI